MLRAQKLEKILNSDEYRNALREFTDSLSATATGAPNEKTIEAWFDLRMGSLFEKWFRPIGYYYEPTKEETVRTLRRQTGRADTSIGTVVIEFKQPQTLSSEKDKGQALAQACDYIEGFNSAGLNKTFGMVTDGTKAAIIYMQAGSEPRMEPFLALGWQHLDKLVKAIIGLRQKQLSPENLVKDFASRPSSPARALAGCLFTILQERPSNRTKMLLSEWKHLFKLSHNDVSQQRDLLERRKALASFLGAAINSVEQEYNALFSLQTAYTVLIKLLAFKAISQVKYEDTLVNFSKLAASDDSALLMQMDNLESGAIIRDYGIQNLLEGDFFSWYTAADQWSSVTAAHIRNMAGRLDEYKATDIFSGTTHAQDFFKLLYYSMMPPQVRHALGEYYTPKWLAKRTVEQALSLLGSKAGWRALDPTCGSGTFLTALIEKVSEEALAKGKERAEILHEITRRVAGIDMNPLAVLTARVNYFLNIAQYITPSTRVEIPVYSGDSAYKPEKTVLNGVDFVKYTLDTEIMPFEYYFPASALKNLAKFSAAMTEIELDIKTGNLDAIRRRLLELVPASERGNAAVIEKIGKLASTFILFEKKNWNGIWARIITNYLSASEIGKFDIIVGNPPWVDWKNLPSAYRERIKSLDITKTIFSGDTFSGGINLNIAALIINTAIQNWLVRDGVLGMLMPDAFLIQQTYEGFRRLILGDGSRAHFIHFDDWRNAGHPFAPVTQKFVGGFISRNATTSTSGIPVDQFIRNRNARVDTETLDFGSIFSCNRAAAIQPNPEKTNLVITSPQDTENYALIGASKSHYRGREGMRFFPLELLLFTLDLSSSNGEDKIRVENIQNPRSQHHIPRQKRLFERDALRPPCQKP